MERKFMETKKYIFNFKVQYFIYCRGQNSIHKISFVLGNTGNNPLPKHVL